MRSQDWEDQSCCTRTCLPATSSSTLASPLTERLGSCSRRAKHDAGGLGGCEAASHSKNMIRRMRWRRVGEPCIRLASAHAGAQLEVTWWRLSCARVRLTPQVVPVFAGGLDFSLPVRKFFYDPLGSGKAFVDCVVSLTGFALVGGPARQDAPKVGFIGLVPCEIGFCGLGFIGFCVPTGYRAVCVVLCSD